MFENIIKRIKERREERRHRICRYLLGQPDDISEEELEECQRMVDRRWQEIKNS